jgi:hypothetical protein
MRLLSRMLAAIQGVLIPGLEEHFGSLTNKHKSLTAILEVVRIEDFIPATPLVNGPGRPAASRRAIARAFVAKAVYNLGSTRALIDQLQASPVLRRLCGFETRREVPHESAFSRAFAEFAATALPERVHRALLVQHHPAQTQSLFRDSTDIWAREKAKPRPKAAPKGKRGRPRADAARPPRKRPLLERQSGMTLEEMLAELPTACAYGGKRDARGNFRWWKGYKLHLDCSTDQVPVCCLLTSASVHDSQVAIPLALMSRERMDCHFEVMDSAYDAKSIDEFCRSLGHEPVIDGNPRRGEKQTPQSQGKYRQRSAVERVFGRLKDEFGARRVRVRGASKVMAHLMFGVLALTADQLLRQA